jgi:hypothetical protein
VNEIPERKDLDPLFQAYRELRIMEQIGYANYQLKDDYRIFSKAPRRQAIVLSHVTLICIIVLCALHVGVLADAASSPTVRSSAIGSVVQQLWRIWRSSIRLPRRQRRFESCATWNACRLTRCATSC